VFTVVIYVMRCSSLESVELRVRDVGRYIGAQSMIINSNE